MAQDKKTPLIEDGKVSIVLDGKEEVLEATIDAALKLSRDNGGLASVMQRLRSLDVDVFVQVVQAGLGREVPPVSIFAAGMNNLLPQCIIYIDLLICGGSRPKKGASKGKQ